MNQKYPRKPSKKLIPITVIKDALGEYWDVYESNKINDHLYIYRGWQYGCTPADEGISPIFSYILTEALSELIKENPISVVKKITGISLSSIGKMRLVLGINRKMVYRDDDWIKAHKNELLLESYKSLKEKFDLSRSQVNQHRVWAAEIFNIPKSSRLRNTAQHDAYALWFSMEYENFKGLGVEEISEKYNLSKYVAVKTFDLYQSMNKGLSYSESIKAQKSNQVQCLLHNNNTLTNESNKNTEIVNYLSKYKPQIVRLIIKI